MSRPIGLFPAFGDLVSATAWKPSTFVIKISGYALFHQKLGRAQLHCHLTNSTSFVMVAAPAIKLSEIGDSYGFRTWIEYGLKQSKDALGWADFHMTSYNQIEKWWEMGMSAFLMVSLFADAFNDACPIAHQQFAQHPWWNNQSGWKHLFNNLRLIIQPLICFNWTQRWLQVFPIASLETGFEQLTEQMNQFVCPMIHQLNLQLIFSSR
jgi:hypothetical protein